MRREQVQQLRVHERLAAQNPEEGVPVLFGVGDGAIQALQLDGVLLLDIYPAALAAKVAGVDDREIEKRRKIVAAFDAPLEFLHGQNPLHAEVPGKFPQATLVGCAQDAGGEGGEHDLLFRTRVVLPPAPWPSPPAPAAGSPPATAATAAPPAECRRRWPVSPGTSAVPEEPCPRPVPSRSATSPFRSAPGASHRHRRPEARRCLFSFSRAADRRRSPRRR